MSEKLSNLPLPWVQYGKIDGIHSTKVPKESPMYTVYTLIKSQLIPCIPGKKMCEKWKKKLGGSIIKWIQYTV